MSNMIMIELNEETMVTMDNKDYVVVPIDNNEPNDSVIGNIGLLSLIGYVSVKSYIGLTGAPLFLMLAFCGCMILIVGRSLLKSIEGLIKQRKLDKAKEEANKPAKDKKLNSKAS